MDLLTAFLTGLVGSLHCLGMCGPIVIGLPLNQDSYGRKMMESLSYNLGRVLTYGLMGAVFGLFGKGIQLAGLQQWASIVLGAVLVISAIWPYIFKKRLSTFSFLDKFNNRLVNALRSLFLSPASGHKSPMGRMWIIGLLNGLLPCGLVYVALAGAVNTNDPLSGTLYMIVFGLATIPALFALSIVGNALALQLRKKFSKLITVFILLLGIIFILRGLDLGIPFISPKTKKLEIRTEQPMKMHSSEEKESCCK
ncbi:MAG: sulfite exporter TauE/SafE family protein [Bacteroidales bacterium]|nr:sulfite exporter TauE/SafE family protein [Bacteroidales bacterium]